MFIRCERCSTMYELDESVLAPEGSPVQCTRCDHVFTAFPPKAAGRTLVGVPAVVDTDRSPSSSPSPPRSGAEGRGEGADSTVPGAAAAGTSPPAAPRASASSPPAPAAPVQRPAARSGAAPVYRPPVSNSGPRVPVVRRDTVGTFEARLRSSARMKWLVPTAAAAIVVLAAGAWLLVRRSGRPDVAGERATALALVARDDAASVDEGIARLGALLRGGGAGQAIAADRALAQVVRAAGIAEEAEVVAARRAACDAERDRLRREQPPGWEEQERALASEARALEVDVREREERSGSLARQAHDALKALGPAENATPEAARALVAYYALRGDRDHAGRAARGRSEGWFDLADAWLDSRESERAARERGVTKLSALVARHPELVRGRFLLGRTLAALGRRPEALATIEAVLVANPRHERAKLLREEFARPDPAPPPLQVNPPAVPRKRSSQPGPAGAAPRIVPAAPVEAGPRPGTTAAPSAGAPASPALAPASTEPSSPPAPRGTSGDAGGSPSPSTSGGSGSGSGGGEGRRPSGAPPPREETYDETYQVTGG